MEKNNQNIKKMPLETNNTQKILSHKVTKWLSKTKKKKKKKKKKKNEM